MLFYLLKLFRHNNTKPFRNGRPLSIPFIDISGKMMKDVRLVSGPSPVRAQGDGGAAAAANSPAMISGEDFESDESDDEYTGPRTFDQRHNKQQILKPKKAENLEEMRVATPSSAYVIQPCPNAVQMNGQITSYNASTSRQRRITCAERMLMINHRQASIGGISVRSGTPTYANKSRPVMPRSPSFQSNSVQIFMQSACKPGRTMMMNIPPSSDSRFNNSRTSSDSRFSNSKPNQFKRLSPPNASSPSATSIHAPLAHQVFGDFKLFKEQQQAIPMRLQVSHRRNVHGECGPTGIPAVDCSNGYRSYSDRYAEAIMGDPLDPNMETDFDFAGNLALFDKAEFNRETEHIFQGLDSAGNCSRNYRNDENVLQDTSRVISWTKSTNVADEDENQNTSTSSPVD